MYIFKINFFNLFIFYNNFQVY